MEQVIFNPIFWLILFLAAICSLLASMLGTAQARAKYFEEHFEEYYEKWYNIHKYANNAYWYLHNRWKQPGNDMDELCKQAYYQLCHWYEDEEGENK